MKTSTSYEFAVRTLGGLISALEELRDLHGSEAPVDNLYAESNRIRYGIDRELVQTRIAIKLLGAPAAKKESK